MKRTSTRRRTAIAASAVLALGMAAVACGEDVVDDDVEREVEEIDEDIKDFVDTAFTDTTGG